MDGALNSPLTAFINGQVLTGGGLRSDLTVLIQDDRIIRLDASGDAPPDQARVVDLDERYLLPGFIDTQVNGGGGVLFNDHPTVEGIERIASAHRAFGTTGLLPTLISDELDVIQRAMAAVESAMEQAVPGVLGIHIEGPFLNADRRGIHDAEKIQQLTAAIVEQLQPLSQGATLITLAPDMVEPALIAALVDKGFIVSGGHSAANQATVRRALDHGMTGFTHLYNAMSQLTARKPGMVGQALADTESWAGIIADGHHVSPLSLEIAWRCKGTRRLMLVTDAMPTVGTDQEEFVLMGNPITVRDGICFDAEGTLAGTALDMARAVRTMTELTPCSLSDACLMASATPAAFLGIEEARGSIEEGSFADLVIMNREYQVEETWINGRKG